MNLSRRSFIASTAVGTFASTGTGTSLPREDGKRPLKAGPLGKYVGELAPGRYDAHTHVYPGEPDPAKLVKSFADAGLRGGVVFSRCPNTWQVPGAPLLTPEEAMDNVIAWCSGSPSIYPFYWIDPGADNAVELVDMATEKGIYGFKVIRGAEKPVDAKSLKCYRRMAEKGKPVTFHTGILWDGRDSSEFFRPANWEGLLEAPHLRFALAHVSWPWCDECIAVYGKILNAVVRRGFEIPEMFIDTTPGTPKLYRKDALARSSRSAMTSPNTSCTGRTAASTATMSTGRRTGSGRTMRCSRGSASARTRLMTTTAADSSAISSAGTTRSATSRRRTGGTGIRGSEVWYE